MIESHRSPLTTIHYLDDLLVIGHDKASCSAGLEIVIDTAKKCGFGIKSSKTVGPSRSIEFLGLVIDTTKQQVRISQERLEDIRMELSEWKKLRHCQKRELLSIIGRLQFCSQVVYPGQMFTRRLIDLSKKAKSLYHRLYLDAESRRDLAWWDKNMADHNGIAWFPRAFDSNSCCIMFSDASGKAAAAVLGNNWTIQEFVGEFKWISELPIAFKELYAAVLGVATFGHQLFKKQLLMNVDNESIHYCIQSGKSKDKHIMGLIRALYYYTSVHHIQYETCHVPGASNILADNLSRGNIQNFFMHLPTAHPSMTRPCRILTNFN